MNEDLPAPLVPSHVDLQGYGFMPLYGHRLFGSEFNARCSDAEWRAGVTLWWAAWNQVPAASLPDDDVALARLADLGKDVRAWKRLRANALHGFVKCSDGRLYHKALSDLALQAWDRRVKERDRKERWRRSRDGDKDVPTTRTETAQNADGTRREERTGEGQGQGPNKSSAPDGAPPSLDLKETVFGQCLVILSTKTGKPAASLRGLVGKWCRDFGEGNTIEAIAAMQREAPVDPIPWLERCLVKRAGSRVPQERLPASRRTMN